MACGWHVDGMWMACGWHVDGWQGSNSVALSLFLLLFARNPQESDECHAACTKQEGIKVPRAHGAPGSGSVPGVTCVCPGVIGGLPCHLCACRPRWMLNLTITI